MGLYATDVNNPVTMHLISSNFISNPCTVLLISKRNTTQAIFRKFNINYSKMTPYAIIVVLLEIYRLFLSKMKLTTRYSPVQHGRHMKLL